MGLDDDDVSRLLNYPCFTVKIFSITPKLKFILSVYMQDEWEERHFFFLGGGGGL